MQRLPFPILTLSMLAAFATEATALYVNGGNPTRHDRFLDFRLTINPEFFLFNEDLTGVSVYGRAVLITRQHYLTAEHYPASPIVQFYDRNGELHGFTTDHAHDILVDGSSSETDIRIGTLTEPIPEDVDVAVYPILAESEIDYVGREIIVFGKNARAGRNIAEEIYPVNVVGGGAIWSLMWTYDTDDNGGKGGLGADECGLENGDSGWTVFTRVPGGLAVIGANWFRGGAPPGNNRNYCSFAPRHLEAIQAVVAEEGFHVVTTLGPRPCSPADLAEPYGEMGYFDLVQYLTDFASGFQSADLAEPFGELSFADLLAYLELVNAGCP